MQLPEPPMLCLVTDRRRCLGRPIEQVAEAAVIGGVDIVQLREKDLPADQLLGLAERLRSITAGKALLFINDRVDVAMAAGADGVQLGERSVPVGAARRAGGDSLIIGRSVHDVEGAMDAMRAEADLLVFGAVFATVSHPRVRPRGVGALRDLARLGVSPFLGIGGITAQNAASVVEAGAAGAAVITAITESPDPQGAARLIRSEMAQARRRSDAEAVPA